MIRHRIVVEKERFSGVHNNVDVSFRDVAAAFCEGDGIFQETLVYRWVEIFNVKYDEFVFVIVWDVGKPFYDGEEFI